MHFMVSLAGNRGFHTGAVVITMEQRIWTKGEGIWLKGNLHGHSTVSDGELPPQKVLEGYRERGYDFFSLTDHNIYTKYESEGLILIPGFELTCYIKDKRIHLNFLQKGEKSLYEHGQRFVIETHEKTMAFIEHAQDDYLIMLNHPDWSLLQYRDVEAMDCLFGMEVFNYGSEWQDRVGESSHFWDAALMDGKRWFGVSTDDNHNEYTTSLGWPFDHVESDSFGGWVMVKAKNRSVGAITEALESGAFYATSGPEIYDFSVQEGIAHVSCSPVSRIIFKGERRNYVRQIGTNLTEFTSPLRGNKEYVRVECIDEQGKVAYSNPIYL